MELLMQSDTTLGVVATLTLAQQQQQQRKKPAPTDNEKGCSDKPNKKATKKQPTATPDESATTKSASPVPSPVPSASAKKYSVHDQRDVIRKVQEQNQILKQELAIERRDAKKQVLALASDHTKQRLEALHKLTEQFTKKTEQARKLVFKLNEQLAKKEHELERLRQQQQQALEGSSSGSNAGGPGNESASAVPETSAAMTRRLRSLENRLELTLVKRNEMDSINKHLRSQIDKVRRDRIIFDGIYKKLEKEMCDFRGRHDACGDELQRVMQAKEQVQQEMAQLEAQTELEQRQYEQQFKTLKAQIETLMRDGALCESSFGFQTTVDDTKGSNKTAAPTSSAAPASNGATPDASPLKRISALSTWKIGFDKALASTNDSLVAKYDQVFDGIKQMTGIRDITQLADAILHKDEENFKRFKHVEELQREEVVLQAELEQLTREIDAYKAQEGIATSAVQKQQCRVLEAKFQQQLEQHKAFDVEYEDATTQLARMKSSIHSIHSMLVRANCAKNVDRFSTQHGNAPLTVGAHSARDITDTNVLEYLQAIEIFTSSLMKETHDAAMEEAAVRTGDGGSGGSAQYLTEAVPPSPVGHGPKTLPSDPTQRLRVQVPSFGGVNGVITVPSSAQADVHEHRPTTIGHVSPSLAAAKMQRKKTGRFELSSRKSLSQQQFAAALAAAGMSPPPSLLLGEGTPPWSMSELAAHRPVSGPRSVLTPASYQLHPSDEDEGERMYTYEELKHLAARHIVKQAAPVSPLGLVTSSLAKNHVT
ncbi:hypothetical protein Poli38472_004491 [Pythium oligandrum]|uniref:ODAD1 central coiled coil region domain-containing protein n=1 Tax=Pythium oligandrum TaxID=41045 RepID=A0A8K1CA80_PYTOL|nr:hypothetical protein Poli38472_004491 [Pythium oligandrum]|eukprot:TMW59422.1 hypothetical protein Poli38472_004491 [Pythium oligandrum]